jgi:hypothetical protein
LAAVKDHITFGVEIKTSKQINPKKNFRHEKNVLDAVCCRRFIKRDHRVGSLHRNRGFQQAESCFKPDFFHCYPRKVVYRG